MASFDTLLRPIRSVSPVPVDEHGLVDRLRLSAVAIASFLLFVPALVLAIFTVLAVALGPIFVGVAIANVVVPLTERLTSLHRRMGGSLLGEEIRADYVTTEGRGFVGRPLVWVRDPRRWRDLGFLAFAASGGALLAGLPGLLLVSPVVYLVLLITQPTVLWVSLASVGVVAWWLVTPGLLRARLRADRSLLGGDRVEELERRIEEVATSRSETLDHSAAEVRRIERDLHDGAQARIASVGMNVGLAEKLMSTDPEAAAALLREARETTVGALEDLRSVVRGIHPPALADRGLAGGLEALALPIPLPVTVTVDAPSLPPPVESAAYFAVAECLANTVKHADAARAWVRVRHDGEVLHLVVGDDGRGGANPGGTGLAGVANRLAAFDGTMVVDSPEGGPTVVTMEVPCPTSPQ
jgi:signal transduction histidine kinase